MKAIINGNIITEQGIVQNQIVIFSETITAIVPKEQISQYCISETFDAAGKYIAPGFIDIHVHGCNGFDAMDHHNEAITLISNSLPQTGVTAFLPTTMTMPFDKIEQAMKRVRHAMHSDSGAEILGCHMEGPFISETYKGAQDKQHIIMADFSKIQPFSDVIKMITIAPELLNDDNFMAECVQHGIVLSIGHSNATYEQAMAAIAAGISHMTHTFNALPPLHHRSPGAIGAALDSEGVVCELIADNIHVHPAMQRLLLKVKGVAKIILITDAMRASMLGAGQYDLGGQMVTVTNGQARLADGVIAGSVLTLNKAVKNFITNTGIDLANAIQLVTLNPARQIGVASQKGSIAIGKHADLVIFDDDVEIITTFVRGKLVYQRV